VVLGFERPEIGLNHGKRGGGFFGHPRIMAPSPGGFNRSGDD
jgi:hypothetical protein